MTQVFSVKLSISFNLSIIFQGTKLRGGIDCGEQFNEPEDRKQIHQTFACIRKNQCVQSAKNTNQM